MKSTFIGFLALTSTVLIFAQTSPIATPDRVLQALAPLVQADVTSSISVSNGAVQLALSTVLAASNQVLASTANATLTITSAFNASAAATAAQQATTALATSVNALFSAQIALQVSQATQASATQLANTFDSLYMQANVTYLAQLNAATGPALQAATGLALNLQQAYTQQKAQLGVSMTNLTTIASSAQSDANTKYPGNSTYAAISSQYQSLKLTLVGALVTASPATVSSQLSTAYQSSSTASTSQSPANSQKAISNMFIALAAISTLSAAADLNVMTTNTDLVSKQTALNLATTNYMTAQTTLNAALLAQTTSAVSAITQQQATGASLGLSQGNATVALASMQATYTQIWGPVRTANFFYNQRSYECATATSNYQTVTASQVVSCQAPTSKACQAANVNVSVSNQTTVFICQNLSLPQSVSGAQNTSYASLANAIAAEQVVITQAQTTVQSSTSTLVQVQNASTQANALSTQVPILYTQTNTLLAAYQTLLQAQTNQAIAYQVDQVYDGLFVQSQAAQVAQNLALTGNNYAAASVLVLALQQAFSQQALFAFAESTNATAAAKAAVTAAAAGTTALNTQSYIAGNVSTFFAAQAALFTQANAAALTLAYSNSILATTTPTCQTAVNSVNAALTVVQSLAAAADANLVTANAALLLAQNAVNLQFYYFTQSQLTVTAAAQTAVTAAQASLNAVTATSTQVGTFYANAIASLSQTAAAVVATNQAGASQNGLILLGVTGCASATKQIIVVTKAKTAACSLKGTTKKANANNAVLCAAATNQVDLAVLAKAQACPVV